MPEGMYLKSDGFASNLSDPASHCTLKHYCEQAGVPYHDTAIPVRLDTFTAYGDMFQKLNVPTLEDNQVTHIERHGKHFRLDLDSGERLHAHRVLMAVGITHFTYIPPELAILPREHVSHSFAHRTVEQFRGREVSVIGSGASAMDLAALLNENGANVTVIARASSASFNEHRGTSRRSLLHQIRHPSSGIGPSLQGWCFSNYPQLFHCLPKHIRLDVVRRFLGPAAGWTVKERIVNRVPLVLGCAITRAEMRHEVVTLTLRSNDGRWKEHRAEHVIAATGYRVDLRKLTFLSEQIQSQLVSDGDSPVLSSAFESSVPGLYFFGLAAANSFGPVLRFTFGADFAARHISKHLLASLPQKTLVTGVPLENA
jgi:thioredoxin reductase